MTWTTVCQVRSLLPERGAAALVGGVQVALFRLLDGTVHAVSHTDPFSGANVMARGIVGSRVVDGEEVPTVTSPMYKQVFNLRTGRCLSDPAVALQVFPVRVVDGHLDVGLTPVALSVAPGGT